jgi:isoquinoline 1-oxidoreductase beta subunit
MLLAEELEVAWESIQYEWADTDPVFGWQYTGGSKSVQDNWEKLRKAGAMARTLLLQAAAKEWDISVNQCFANNGRIFNTSNDKSFSFGQLADAVSKLSVPESVPLKTMEEFRLIGKSVPSLDIPQKINGAAIYGIDVRKPDMLIATIAHRPVFGGKLLKVEQHAALKIPGVRQVVVIESGVAVVAEHYWAAKKGLDALEIQWKEEKHKKLNSQEIREKLVAKKDNPQAEVIDTQGNLIEAASSSVQFVEVSYESPMQSQSPMEPMNATAHVYNNHCEVWAPTQVPSSAQKVAAKYTYSGTKGLLESIRSRILGKISLEGITVYRTFLGGGFGRRLQQDYVAEAVQISKAVGQPVKLIWSREEDTRFGFYRPYVYTHMKAGLDEAGMPLFWDQHIVASTKQKVLTDTFDIGYTVKNRQLRFSEQPLGIPVGSWRSVVASHMGFFKECFIDELAFAAGKDPVVYRYDLLSEDRRYQHVLIQAAEYARWGKPLQEGHALGVAVHASKDSYVCQIVELSVDDTKNIKVHKVVCVIDCGTVVNPDTVQAQMEGSIVYGLTAALKGEITIENGRVQQSNFDDYPMLRMDEMPVVETYIVKSTEKPGGVGEPGVPPVAPAVANAVFAATGIRVRKLPILPFNLA